MIVPELEFRNIERHIFPADLVERADHAPLEYRPEAFNRVRVDRADNVFAVAMIEEDAEKVVPGTGGGPVATGGSGGRA